MTPDQTTALETELAALDDDALIRLCKSLDAADPRADIVAGEMERRNLDE